MRRPIKAIAATIVKPPETPLEAFHAGLINATTLRDWLALPADNGAAKVRAEVDAAKRVHDHLSGQGCRPACPGWASDGPVLPSSAPYTGPQGAGQGNGTPRTSEPVNGQQTSATVGLTNAEELEYLQLRTRKAIFDCREKEFTKQHPGDEQPEEDEFLPPMPAANRFAVKTVQLDPEQTLVVEFTDGPLFVPATAGCGKTAALVARMAKLIDMGVPGDRIIACTFSKKAADEMNKRLNEKYGVTSCRVGTWHSLAMQVIKEDHLPQSQWAVDEKDRHKFMVKDAAGWKHVDWKGVDITKVLSFIGWCKAHVWDPDDAETAEYAEQKFGQKDARKAVDVYRISDDLTHQAGLLTFDDMLVYVAKHLAVDENAASWAGRWDYVLQDEAQDANVAQMRIAKALAQGHRNYMIVGDSGQAIFGFRGSNPAHFVGFEREWQATRINLCRNYRSGDAIVKAGNAVIKVGNPDAVDMIPMRGVPGKVTVVAGDTLEDEAQSFVSWVQQHVAEGSTFGSCTALFRTNAQSRALEEKLLSARIPYVIIGGHSFYERKEIKDLLGYLRVAMGRDPDGEAVKRCINAPFRFLGAKFVDRVMDLGRPGCSWPQVISQAARQAGIQRRQEASADEWCDLIAHVTRQIAGSKDDAKPATILNDLVQKTGFIAWLEKEEGEESIESSHAANVRELIRVSERFATCGELLDYVDKSIREMGRQRKDNTEGEGRVTLMSIHRSKGLEYPHVWVCGCCEGILPHARGDEAEERRLMYVAITRGRDEVVLSWVRRMALKGGVKAMEPSHFIADAGFDAEPMIGEEYQREQSHCVDPNTGAVHVGAQTFLGTPLDPANGVSPYLARKMDGIEGEMVEMLDEHGIDDRRLEIEGVAAQLSGLLD
jgi:DNA helicase-2/ATP-dependent DNA helicase PcrA